MAGFTVLTDSDVKKILSDLTPFEVAGFAGALEQALGRYSSDGEAEYQPARAVVKRPDGQVSLFMPATTQQSIGVKIVGIRPTQDPSSLPPGQKPLPGLTSALTLCDAQGQAVGILNAAELTAFRTALGSMLLYKLRKNTENIVVFGAGKQAVWHIRLAVLLRGGDIEKITVINRSTQRTQELINELRDSSWPAHIELTPFDESAGENALERLLVDADVLFCTTPSTKSLFPASFLTSEAALRKTRFIGAIGSYRLDMKEIDPELLKMVIDPTSKLSAAVWNGRVTVDTAEGCMEEAGELVEAGITPKDMLEVGHILQSYRSDASQTAWLESGFVIYKSVGIGIMDIAIGKYMLELAGSKGIGLRSPSF